MRDSCFKNVFLRGRTDVGLMAWIRMIVLEVYIGEQLIELFHSFASYTKETEFDGFTDAAANGYKTSDIEEFIPATLINRALKNEIVKLLKCKYLDHYNVIRSYPRSDKFNGMYEVNNERLYMLSELRLTYNTIWIGFNAMFDVAVYIFTKDLSVALATGAVIEFIRRFKV